MKWEENENVTLEDQRSENALILKNVLQSERSPT